MHNWKALSTITATRAGTVEVTCQGYGGSRFGVGSPLPTRRLFNGVAYASGTAVGIVLVTLVFLLAIAVVITVSTLAASRKKWINRFWAPLLLSVITMLSFNSVWDAVTLFVVWNLAAWLLRRWFSDH